VKRRDQAHSAIAIQQMDDAPVGERRDGQPCDLSQVRLAIQRGEKRRPGFSKHALTPVGRKTLVPRHDGRSQSAEGGTPPAIG
jgi:hypothetical protein